MNYHISFAPVVVIVKGFFFSKYYTTMNIQVDLQVKAINVNILEFIF